MIDLIIKYKILNREISTKLKKKNYKSQFNNKTMKKSVILTIKL